MANWLFRIRWGDNDYEYIIVRAATLLDAKIFMRDKYLQAQYVDYITRSYTIED